MTMKTRTIDQLIKLSTRVAEAWIKNPGSTGSAMTSKAILAVCKHLSHEASYRTDIAELVRACQSAAKPPDEIGLDADQSQAGNQNTQKVLTARQIEILQLFSRGLSYQEVGEQLNVTTQTIKNHASAIYERLGVKNKTEAVFEARSIGLLI